MELITHILVILLLVVSILAIGKLWVVLNGVQRTVVEFGPTRKKLDATLQQAAALLKDLDELTREEIKPMLVKARAALTSLEVTTRAAAETTAGLRNLIGAGESDSRGAVVAKLAVAAGARIAMNAAAGLAKAAVQRLLRGRRPAPQEPPARRRRRISR
ncbi:MAG: hypothetical protein KGJ62_15665 [Armatimonadetes bacterium]|nr:hypothetical protein [Armatimonadota bacterium]MDE2207843.1 hypothetical protein [Armatimonadota bacterium]